MKTNMRHRALNKANPKWADFYFLGVAFSKRMHPRMTLRDLAGVLGVTYQTAYTESVVALGKLIYGISRIEP